MTILAKIPIFAGKNYFCQSGCYRRKKRFFPPSGKNLPTLFLAHIQCRKFATGGYRVSPPNMVCV